MDREDKSYRAEVVHKMFTGVKTENYDLVSDTLVDYEKVSFERGHIHGFLLGLVIGAIIGCLIAGIASCVIRDPQGPTPAPKGRLAVLFP
jgi:hypothetical protein